MAKAARQRLKRADFQELAKLRIAEAEHLMKAGSFSGAYYIAGLAVECSLKACIARATEQFEFPDLDCAKESWNHDLTRLLNAAGLVAEHEKKAAADVEFNANWLIVKDWDVSSRYEKRSKAEAQNLFEAVVNAQHGVFGWIEGYW